MFPSFYVCVINNDIHHQLERHLLRTTYALVRSILLFVQLRKRIIIRLQR